VNRGLTLAFVLVFSVFSSAVRVDAQAPSTVAFSTIDRATVRVFAAGDVQRERVQGRFRQRVLGIPAAGHGTGVVVDPRGVILTAKHVVDGARHAAVRLPGDGPVLPTRVVYADEALDFALLLVLPAAPLTAIELPADTTSLNVRDTVDAIGYPFDPDRRQPQSARGIISGELEDGHLQLDMSLNPGNSGGPLLLGDRLVGIVVARADPTRGAQGIGIAVPVDPIRQAYDQIRSSGQLARAYEVLRANLENATRAAEAVDAIVRLGGANLLQEAADFVENPEASQRIDTLRAMATRTRDPDLLGLLSAFFWNAAQVMVERAGGAATPAHMSPGPAQRLADELWRLAIQTATVARDADPTLVDRSPFVGYLAARPTASAAVPRPTSPVVVRPADSPGLAASGGSWRDALRNERDHQPWSPWVLMGFNLLGGRVDAGRGFGLRAAALLPLGPRDGRTGVRVRPVLGPTLDVGVRGGDAVYFIGSDAGLGIRFGGSVGAAFLVAWSQGYQRSVFCSPFDGDCSRHRTAYVPLGAHLGASLRLGTFHIGLSFRILDTGRLEEMLGTTWSLSVPQVSWTF